MILLFVCFFWLFQPVGWGFKNWKMLFKLAILDDLLSGRGPWFVSSSWWVSRDDG